MNQLPEWITDPALRPAWDRIRAHFENVGLEPRGRVRVPVATREQRHALGALLGRTITADAVRVDLGSLDSRLRERSGGGGVAAVLAVLYGADPEDRPAARAARDEARERPLLLGAELVAQPWADDWLAGLRRTGLLTNRPGAERTIRDAATVLLELAGSGGPLVARSRVELGATLLGDAHALDRDRVLHQVVVRGLAAAVGQPIPLDTREREHLWARFGVEPDLLSRTCLVWRLRACGEAGTGQRLNQAAESGDPIHLTEWDLRRLDRIGPPEGSRVLVCENPRVVEALAERAVAGWSVVCTSGEPNLVVDAVLGMLVSSGVVLNYHGDFDWPGVAIANRVAARFGARPWRMGPGDYVAAVRPDGPVLAGTPVEPSWEPELAAAMRHHGRAVHEESVLAELMMALGTDP